MIRRYLKSMGVLVLTRAFVACGDPTPDMRGSNSATILVQGFALNESEPDGSDQSLTQKVQGVTRLQIEVKDCRSGYHIATSAAERIKLYKHDQNCKLALHGFQWNGESFRPSKQALTGPAGTMAWFRSQHKEVPVVISSMISSPIKDDDEVGYSIASRIVQGDSKSVLGIKVGESKRIRRRNHSVHAPLFNVRRAKIIAMIPNTKSFGMRFELECTGDIKHEMSPDLRKCVHVKLRDLSYQLVEDRYLGRPTVEQMDVLFAHGSIPVDPANDYQPSAGSFHGGFSTSAGPVILRTPTNTAAHPHMILILRSPRSYEYFNLDMRTAGE